MITRACPLDVGLRIRLAVGRPDIPWACLRSAASVLELRHIALSSVTGLPPRQPFIIRGFA
jgi:hypothetical protein